MLFRSEWGRAAAYASELGGRARQQYAMREAIAYYGQALLALTHVVEPREELVFDVLLGWEDAAFNFTPYEAQLARLSRAEDIARKLNDKPRLIRALHWTANVLLARGLWTQAGPVLEESLDVAKEVGDERLSVRPLFFKGLMTSFASPADALKWTDLAQELSHKHDEPQIEALVFAMQGHVFAQLGDFDRALQALEHAREISSRLAAPILDSDVDLFSAWSWLVMGNRELAKEFGDRSVRMAIATDNMDCICSGMVCLGYINLELGKIADAASAFEEGIERSDVSGAKIHKQNGQAGLAMTRFKDGHPDAIQALEAVIVEMTQFQNRVGAAGAYQLLGTCLIQLGKLEQASNALTEAMHFYRQSQMYPYLGRTLRSMAELRDKQGRGAEAQEYRQEAESIGTALRHTQQ